MPTDRFYTRDPVFLAKRLLGCTLVRVLPDGTRLAGMIVETEAYCGVEDTAAHSVGWRRTERTEPMFARGGTAYVYFTYGMHHCFNVVCGKVDEPVAVLIRAVEPTEGIDAMRARRQPSSRKMLRDRDLCSGPARLCEAMEIDRRLNMHDLTLGESLWIELSQPVHASKIQTTARIGVPGAGEWATRPLRWFIAGNLHVSPGRPTTQADVDARNAMARKRKNRRRAKP